MCLCQTEAKPGAKKNEDTQKEKNLLVVEIRSFFLKIAWGMVNVTV